MLTQIIQAHRRWLVSAALGLTLAGVFLTRTAFAKIMRDTIDPGGQRERATAGTWR